MGGDETGAICSSSSSLRAVRHAEYSVALFFTASFSEVLSVGIQNMLDSFSVRLNCVGDYAERCFDLRFDAIVSGQSVEQDGCAVQGVMHDA